MNKKPEVAENTMDGHFFLFILWYILLIMHKPRNYMMETHLKLYLVERIFDYWSDLMVFIIAQSVSPYYRPPWCDGIKGKKHTI